MVVQAWANREARPLAPSPFGRWVGVRGNSRRRPSHGLLFFKAYGRNKTPSGAEIKNDSFPSAQYKPPRSAGILWCGPPGLHPRRGITHDHLVPKIQDSPQSHFRSRRVERREEMNCHRWTQIRNNEPRITRITRMTRMTRMTRIRGDGHLTLTVFEFHLYCQPFNSSRRTRIFRATRIAYLIRVIREIRGPFLPRTHRTYVKPPIAFQVTWEKNF